MIKSVGLSWLDRAEGRNGEKFDIGYIFEITFTSDDERCKRVEELENKHYKGIIDYRPDDAGGVVKCIWSEELQEVIVDNRIEFILDTLEENPLVGVLTEEEIESIKREFLENVKPNLINYEGNIVNECDYDSVSIFEEYDACYDKEAELLG